MYYQECGRGTKGEIMKANSHVIFTGAGDKGRYSISGNTLRVYYANYYKPASINGANVESLAQLILMEMVATCEKKEAILLL